MEAIYADLNEIVFENKEHAYGGYALRVNYPRRMMISLLVSMLLFTLLTTLPQLWGGTFARPPAQKKGDFEGWGCYPGFDSTESERWIVGCFGFEFAIGQSTILIPNPVPDSINSSGLGFLFYTVDMDSDSIAKSTLVMGGKDTLRDSVTDHLQVTQPRKAHRTIVIEKGEDTETDSVRVISPAMFTRRIQYPAVALEAEISGEVIVKVQYDQNGRYMNHVIIRDPHPILTKAVVDFIQDPNTLAVPGSPLNGWVLFPVLFQLRQ